MAELVLTPTTTSIEVEVVDLSDEYEYFSFSIYTYPGPSSGRWINDSGGYINRNYIEFTDLDPNTHYSIFCDYSIDKTNSLSLQGDVRTLEEQIDSPDSDEQDPENPDINNSKYEWYCYDITNEQWLSNEGEDNLPITRPNLSSSDYEYIGYVYYDTKDKCVDWYRNEGSLDGTNKIVYEADIIGNYYTIVFFYKKILSITPWDWKLSNGKASAEVTSKAHNAIEKKGSLSDFSYEVWNDMCAKVREIRLAAGVGEWDTGVYGISYDNTRMSPKDKNLTANRFNSLRYNIDLQHKTGIDEVSSGDIVYGKYFEILMLKVNEWLATL